MAFDQGGLEIQLYLWLIKYATARTGADISVVPGKVGALASKEDLSRSIIATLLKKKKDCLFAPLVQTVKLFHWSPMLWR